MLSGNTNSEKIWNYLIAHGLTPCGAAGVLASIDPESGCQPNNLQNTGNTRLGMTDDEYTAAVDSGAYADFDEDRYGYGICQWTYPSRKKNLRLFAKSAGKSIGDLEMQLDFLMKEMSESFKSVLSVLKTAADVKTASDSVLMNYEKPASVLTPGEKAEQTKRDRAAIGQMYYNKYALKTETGGTTVGTNITTGKGLAEAALNVAKNFKTLYVMGCFGAPMNAANKKRYTQNHEYNKAADRTAMINAASADTFGFDCVCLIKGLLWGWCGDKNKTYGGAGYAVNGVPDIGADTMITKCSGVSTDFSKIEVGEAVWMTGHIGIYVGDGLAVECTPSWKNCVQITAVSNIGPKSGYNARKWTKHGKLPYITYESGGAVSTGSQGNSGGSTASTSNIKVGDEVEFIGTKHYSNSNAINGLTCKPGKAKVTQIASNGKHPYHLIKTTGSTSTVYGWVDAADIAAGVSVQKGATVKVKQGAKTYTGGSLASFVYSNTYTVIQVNGDRVVIGQNGVVTAAVKMEDLIIL